MTLPIRKTSIIVFVTLLSVMMSASVDAKLVFPMHWIPDFSESGIDPHWARDTQDKVLWGYIDRKGAFLIPPTFDHAEPFWGNAAEVETAGRKYLIDRTGRKVEKRINEDSVRGSDGDAEIAFEKDIFDATGTQLIAAKGKDIIVHTFSDGLAKFSMPMRMIEKYYPSYFAEYRVFKPITKEEEAIAATQGQFGYIDEQGRIIIPPKFYRAAPFQDGLAQIQLEDEHGGLKGGFIDREGHLLGDVLHSEVNPFSEGFAVVDEMTYSGTTYEIINREGKAIADNLQKASAFSNGVAVIKRNDRWALIDTKGQVIKQLDYDDVDSFRNGLALVSKGEAKGFIDSAGQLITSMRFADAMPFSNGVAAVGVALSKQAKLKLIMSRHDWKVGYIDTQGTPVIAARFIGARFFTEGLAPVRAGLNWGYIDKTGTLKIKPQFDDARSFSDGLAAVRLAFKWGFIDRSGNWVIKPQFCESVSDKQTKSHLAVGKFSDGIALAQSNGGLWQFIDRKGSTCIKHGPWDSPREQNNFHEGLALVHTNGGSWKDHGYVDKHGNVILDGYSGFSGPFSEGIAMVSYTADSKVPPKIGYIDKAGKFVIAPTYDDGRSFRSGLVAVAHGSRPDHRNFVGKWGFVDKTGHRVVAEIYDDAGDFSEGLAAIKSGGKWGFIDKTGNTVVAAKYDHVDGFSNGRALVKSGRRYGFIDHTGKVVIPIKYWLAAKFSDGLALIVYPENENATVTIGSPLVTPLNGSQDIQEWLNGIPPAD